MGCTHSQASPKQKYKARPTTEAAPLDYEAKAAASNFGLSNHEIIKPLGAGGTGETWLCKRKDSSLQEAVKVINRGPLLKSLEKLLTNEIVLQAKLSEGHVNIVDAHEVVLSESHLCLFLEFIPGGTLTDFVSMRGESVEERGGLFLSEDEARYLFRQCISAVDYLHARNVAHRDLKLDNTLLDKSDPPRVKICDFGFAKLMDNNMTTGLGTAVYMSPQQIQKSQGGYKGTAADVWACGVLLYVMLLGAFPFEHSTAAADEQRAFNEVHFEQLRIDWKANERNKEAVKRMSAGAMDLLDKIFKIDEKERITVAQIKEHPWYTAPLSDRFAKAMEEIEAEQAELDSSLDLARASDGTARQEEAIKKVVQCACSTRMGNIKHADLEGKVIYLSHKKEARAKQEA